MDKYLKNLSTSELNDIELLDSVKNLSAHMQNKMFYSTEMNKLHKGIKIYESFRTKNLRQRFFDECTFDNADFYQASLAGSLFSKCKFYPTNFYDTNLQSCDFRQCYFKNLHFESTRFNKGIFYDVVFEKCIFESAIFNDSIFENCKFINCDWVPLSIENAVFRNTSFINLKIRKMNFEYVTFENVTMDNVKLPFPTIPFIYNGLSYISKTNDNIRITSAKYRDGITVEEYLSNIPYLKKYFKSTCEYFPLANILIMQENYDEAIDSIKRGIDLAIKLRRFRMIKYFCKQLNCIPKLDYNSRQIIFNQILEQLSKQEYGIFEIDILNMYLPEVRRLLIEDYAPSKLQLMFETNIDGPDIKKINILISEIDNFLHSKCQYSIELRHNSPWGFFLNILTNPEMVSNILRGISIVLGINRLISTITKPQIKQSQQQIYKQVKSDKKLKKNNIQIKNVTIINNGTIIFGDDKSKKD